MLSLYDSIIDNLPGDAQAIAGYTGGRWPTAYADWFRGHRAQNKLTIAISAGHMARCLDVEPGDANPDQAPGWYHMVKSAGVAMPVVYASSSNMYAVLTAMDAAGIPRDKYQRWTAHYTKYAHICGDHCGYGGLDPVATQYNDVALGRNLDVSLVDHRLFGAPPKPIDQRHYERYPTGPFPYKNSNGKIEHLNERALVREYDKYHQHPFFYRYQIHHLRVRLKFLRDRCKYEAFKGHDGQFNVPADWGSYWRGWRWQRLNERLH